MALGDQGHTLSGGVSPAGQVALAYQAGRGLWLLAVTGTPPVDGSWPECRPARKSAFSSSPQPRGGGSARDTPPRWVPLGDGRQDRQSGYLKSYFLAGKEQDGICKLGASVLNEKILSQTLKSAA